MAPLGEASLRASLATVANPAYVAASIAARGPHIAWRPRSPSVASVTFLARVDARLGAVLDLTLVRATEDAHEVSGAPRHGHHDRCAVDDRHLVHSELAIEPKVVRDDIREHVESLPAGFR